MKQEELLLQFQAVEDDFNDALCTNNILEISKYISPDWVILEPQFGIISKERFLHTIERGDLYHTTMRKKVIRVKLYNDIAIVTAKGTNNGIYKGEAFNAEQWITSVYKKESENWTCVMTQEAPVTCNDKSVTIGN